MHKDIAMHWCDELESGRFTQGFSFLNNHGKFCCYGVLSEMAREAGVVKSVGAPDSVVAYAGAIFMPPYSVLNWAGICLNNSVSTDIVTANDSGVSFEEIAEFIRKNYQDM